MIDHSDSETHSAATRQFAEILRIVDDAIISVDASHSITRFNRGAERIFGYAAEEAIGQSLEMLLPQRFREHHRAQVQGFGAAPEAARIMAERGQIYGRRKDGTEFPAEASIAKIGLDTGIEFMVILRDVSERKKMEYEQLRYTRHLRKLSQRLIAVQEEERRRLAAELHDRASPNLAAIKITLASLAGSLSLEARRTVEPHLSDAIALLDDTTTGIRAICADLRPVLLDYSGLVPALEGYAAQFSKRTAIAVRVHAPRSGKVRLGKNRESALFRIVQEALTNCAKHADASTVDIELADDDGQTTLTIKDDGAGFAATATTPADAMPGLGLITMKERTEFMGGTFVVTSHPSAGTEIRVTLDNRKIRGQPRKTPSDPLQECLFLTS